MPENKTENKKIPTGIKGMDNALRGGIPEGSQVLLAGGPGVGKTLTSFEILYHAAKSGIPCSMVIFEEQQDSALRNIKSTFSELEGVDELISTKILQIEGEDSASKIFGNTSAENYTFGDFVSDIEDIIKANKSKMLVIDSMSFIKFMVHNRGAYRRSLISMLSNMRRMGVTSIMTTEMQTYDRSTLTYNQDFFLFDGIITMYQLGEEHERLLAMEVIKMRGANHSRALIPYDITPSGIKMSDI